MISSGFRPHSIGPASEGLSAAELLGSGGWQEAPALAYDNRTSTRIRADLIVSRTEMDLRTVRVKESRWKRSNLYVES